jgi:hypothetical protein
VKCLRSLHEGIPDSVSAADGKRWIGSHFMAYEEAYRIYVRHKKLLFFHVSSSLISFLCVSKTISFCLLAVISKEIYFC